MQKEKNHVYLLQRGDIHHQKKLKSERKHDSGHSRDYHKNLFYLVMKIIMLYIQYTEFIFSLKLIVWLHKTQVSQQLKYFLTISERKLAVS